MELKRYAIVHRCVCTAEDRGNGWGCCCARPAQVVESETGELILVPVANAHPLATMLEAQRQLQVEAYGADPMALEGDERIEYIRWNMLALADELHEALHETGWKPWATDRFVNENAFIREMVDAWHFFMNLLLAGSDAVSTEMLDEQFTLEYFMKRERNAARQREGYTGTVGGAEHDAAHT